MMVTVSNDTQGNIFMYHSDFRVSSVLWGTSNLDYQIQNAVGSYLCLLTTINQVKALMCASEGGAWQDRKSAHGIAQNSVVHLIPLWRSYYGILVLDENRRSGNLKIYLGNNSQTFCNQDHELALKERPYQIQSDGILNIVIYSDEFFYWFHLAPSLTDPRFSVKLQTDDIDTGDKMIAMALSRDKLTILYDQRVDYYGITLGQSRPFILLIFSKEFTTDIKAEGAYRFGLACVCQTLKRFQCYSSTLNCLLIKKGSSFCRGRDHPPAP